MALEEPETIVGKMPPARWEVKGVPAIVFPVERIEVDYENRLVQHERAYRDGARLDDTGGKAKTYTFTVAFFNSDNHEAGLDPDGAHQYPEAADLLERACEVHETGDLVVPTKGKRRCRAMRYRRVDEIGEIDNAAFVVTFLEDNEDDAAAAALQQPTAHSVIKQQAIEAVDAAEEFGATSLNMAQLKAFAAELEDLATSPGRFVADLEAKATAVANLADRVYTTFTTEGKAGVDELGLLLTDPSSSRAGRMLARLADTAARILADRHTHLGRIITRTFDADLSIFDVAARTDQDVIDLMAINPQLPDALHIPRGTPVRVLDDAA